MPSVNEIVKLRKRIEALNAEFDAMTPAKKRVQIAKDVVGLVKAEMIIAKKKTYLQPLSRKVINAFKRSEGDQVSDLLEGVQCKACGIGSGFVAAVRRKNKCTTSDMYSCCDDEYMKEYLGEWFSKNQISLIECAFEKDTSFSNSWDGDEGRNSPTIKAVEFGKKYKDDEARLLAIWQNIIDNDGTFKP